MRHFSVPVMLVILAAVLCSISGCSMFKQPSSEGDAMVGIAVDGRLAEMTRSLTDQIFDDFIETPYPERRFFLRYVGEDSLGTVNNWQNVVLIGALEETDPISQRVQRMLGGEATQQVISGELRVLRRKDAWASGQTIVVVAAPTADEVVSWLSENGEIIDDLLTEDRNARMKKAIYSQYEQKDLADSLREAHGWNLRIPHDYAISYSSTDPSFVRFRRQYPARFVTVAWEMGTPDSVNSDKLIRWRDELGLLYPDSSRSNPIILDTVWTTLGGVDALEAHGIWETYGPIGGGPFVAYLLHKEGTLYLLDGKLFAPDREKEPVIRHLEVVLSTFEP